MFFRKFKQRCISCKKNMVLMKSRYQKAVCDECNNKLLTSKIADPMYKELFDIPPELYQKSYFLKDIRCQYARFERLSEKQIETFRRVAKEMQEEKPKEEDQSIASKPATKKTQKEDKADPKNLIPVNKKKVVFKRKPKSGA